MVRYQSNPPMKNVSSIITSALLVGLVGCGFYTSKDDGPSNGSSEQEETAPAGERGSKSNGSSSGTVVKGEPTTSLSYKGPFIVGDGTNEQKGDAQCQSSLGVKTAPSSNELAFPIEIQGTVTALSVKVAKLCGGEVLETGYLLLQKDGITIKKEELDFGDSADVVRDNTVTFEADDETSFEPGSYAVVLSAESYSYGAEKGRFNDIAAASLDIGVLGSGKLVKVGEPNTGPRAEVHWDDTFSVGAPADSACQSNLGAAPATSLTKRFQIEIDGDVTDLAFEIEKTCGGEALAEPEVRIYEGDTTLIVKAEAGSSRDEVISTVVHANAGSSGRPIKPGLYTLEFASHGKDDASVSGINAWVIGTNATIKKR